jgi:hypothetical protein
MMLMAVVNGRGEEMRDNKWKEIAFLFVVKTIMNSNKLCEVSS